MGRERETFEAKQDMAGVRLRRIRQRSGAQAPRPEDLSAFEEPLALPKLRPQLQPGRNPPAASQGGLVGWSYRMVETKPHV